MAKETVTVTDNVTGKSIELPIYHGTHGPGAVDIKAFFREFGYVTYHPQRNEKGQYRGGIYTVHEAPESPRTKIPHAAIPDVAEPDTAPPDMVKQHALTSRLLKNPKLGIIRKRQLKGISNAW